MTTTNKTNRFTKWALALVFVLCFAILGQIPYICTKVFASQVASTQITITNGDFNDSTTTVLQSTPNGWSKEGSSTGKNGIIDVSNSTFSNSSRLTTYALTSTQNPSTAYSEFDNKILMINAKSSSNSNETNHVGYKSNAIELEAYSFYKISLFTLTQENAVASIYISGLDEEISNTQFERYSSNVWTEYKFYIATGINKESINIELWLGSKTKDTMNAVFFDHITMNKISGSYFYDEAGYITKSLSNPSIDGEEKARLELILKNRNIIDLRDYEEVLTNADFETGDKTGWTVVNHLSTDAGSSVVSVNNRASMEAIGKEFLGSDLSENNNYALMLYSVTDKKTHVSYESESFKVSPYETYKITVWAKVSSDFSGNAYITLNEQDNVKNFYSENDDFYTPVSQSVTISKNTENEITNDYTPYYIYVKGHELFETSFKLQLSLGNSETDASGSVIFDNIKFEKISWEQFSNAETSNTATIELTTITNDPTVSNGAFNNATDLEKDFSYPVVPSDWTNEMEETSKSIFGIINTYSPIYEANKANFGGARNPKNPSSAGSVDSDVNNILMMYNKTETYQSVTSSTITLAKQSYQKISFDYKTVQQSTNKDLMNVYVIDEDNNILFADENLYSENWTTYTLLIRSTEYTNTLKLVVSIGSEDNKVAGYVYIDNVKFETDDTMTDETYEQYVESHKTLDFDVTNFSFISPETKYGIHTAYRYEQKLEAGTPSTSGTDIAYGGIIDGENNSYGVSNSENNSHTLKYMPAFIVNNVATYTLTAKEALSLEKDKYYKISIDVYTKFWGDTEQTDRDDDEKYKFGATFSLNGIEKSLSEIVSNDTWTTYTMYVEVSSTKEVNLKFGILNESPDIQGQAFFDNFLFETIDEMEYNQGVENAKTDNKLLAITTEDTSDDEDDTPDTNTTDSTLIWYIIPTVTLFAALVIAIVAYYMKKVTIKKWERKKASEYDRNATLHRDVIRREAEQIRDKQIKEVESQIKDIQTEIERIEQIHKDNIKAQKTSTGNISRAMERDFKAYAKRHTALENQIETLKEKINSLNMPEHLLSIQRNLMLEKIRKEKQEKELERKTKKANKK